MSYDNIRLEKGLYSTGKSFTQALEELDPSQNYVGTELESLDAYERQLKRFDIKVSGKGSDTVSKFFSTTDSAALFPEYVSRAVRCGMENNNVLDKLVATTTTIDSLDYRAVESVPSDDEKELKDVAEGAFIPETIIRTKETLTPLRKRGRMLVASYEAIKFQKLDLFTVTLKQIGAHIATSQLKDAIIELVNDTEQEDISSNTITYSDLVDIWNSFDPYKLSTIITNPAITAQMLKLPEFRDSNAGLNFHATGDVITPFGAEIIKTKILDEAPLILGIDNTCALEKVQAGDVVTEYDKLIDRQLERATITSITGFSKIFPDATKCFALSE